MPLDNKARLFAKAVITAKDHRKLFNAALKGGPHASEWTQRGEHLREGRRYIQVAKK